MVSLLDDVTVLDLGRHHAGPYCAKLFADAGARVIHVEHPDGDPIRSANPAAFAFLNAGKESITLDFGSIVGAELLRELVNASDVLVENFRPGTLERYGLGTEALLESNPSIVRVSLTNFGLTGPYRNLPASEMTLQAASGLMDGNGSANREPLRYPMNIAQHWAGANAAYAALTAYWHALLTGQGQQVDVSIQESLANTWYLVYADYEYTGSLQARGQRDLLEADDGRFLARWQSSVPWEEFAIAFDALELVTDPDLQSTALRGSGADRVYDAIENQTRNNSRGHWMQRAMEYEIPVGILQSLDEIADCDHLKSRNFWDEMDVPGDGPVPFPGLFWHTDGQPNDPVRRSVPSLGEDNEAIYRGLLDKSEDELAALRSSGVIT